jgi:ankyrin repeat protein
VNELQINITDVGNFTNMTMGLIALPVYFSTPLIRATYAENLDEIKTLSATGAKINAADKNSGETALHAAIGTGNVEITEYLLTHGAKANMRDAKKRTPLMMLDEDATPELIDLLLRFGAKTTLIDKEKNTVLHHFAEYGKSETIRILIVYGANINAVNNKKQTALMIATDNGNVEVVRTLLGSGADAGLKNSDDETAYDLASNDEIKDLLISYGAASGAK